MAPLLPALLLAAAVLSCRASITAAADPLGPGAGPWVVESPAAHGL